jgi:membrane-bound metal-dependent hydrolase YbcI (DUF457 family)
MDNLTHTLFAATLARTPLRKAGRGTTAALLLASSAPDIDFVAALKGPGSYLVWHRGPTHGLLGVAGLSVAVAGLVLLGQRLNRRWRGEKVDASFPRLVAVAALGVFLHIAMDFPTSYGTRLLSPFDWHWYAVDWMPIVDVYLLAVLAGGLLFAGPSPAARQRNAAIVIAFMVANYGLRATTHREALRFAPRVVGPSMPANCAAPDVGVMSVAVWPRAQSLTDRGCLVEIAAIPTFLSPFSWRVIAQASNAYQLHDIDLLDGRWRNEQRSNEALWRTTLRYPNLWTEPVLSASTARLAQMFLGFSRFPAARGLVDERSGIVTARWTDMRFVGGLSLEQPTAPRMFTVTVRLGLDGRVMEQRLGR